MVRNVVNVSEINCNPVTTSLRIHIYCFITVQRGTDFVFVHIRPFIQAVLDILNTSVTATLFLPSKLNYLIQETQKYIILCIFNSTEFFDKTELFSPMHIQSLSKI